MINRPALRYYGGKWNLAKWIISYFPPHKNYVDPCGGSAAILLQKKRSQLETYNDIDQHVVNFFQTLRNHPDELLNQIRLTPWSRTEFELSKTPVTDPIENARRFFVSIWMSISNQPFNKATGMRMTSYAEQSYSPACKNYFELINGTTLQKVAERFIGVQIENRDAIDVIRQYDHETTLIYFDPPYVAATRSQSNQYMNETDNAFHIAAASALHQAKGYVVLSGYNCPLYEELYPNFIRYDHKAQTNSGGERIESVWLSPKTSEGQQITFFPTYINIT
jgi:DNA adenine methylase